MPDIVETYLQELAHIRSSGVAVKEISYYPVLSKLLNEVGKQLKPRVTCIMSLANQGAGLPDGGLFTPDQFQSKSEMGIRKGLTPNAGVIEVKGTSDEAWITASGSQVSRYWERYGQVLVTNYRDFLLIGKTTDGKMIKLESFRFAEDESSFWALAANPRKTAQALGDRLVSYLKRVMLHYAPIIDPKDLAWFIASYAREAMVRIEGKNLPSLDLVRSSLEESLGIKFEGQKGDHFFRSTLVQTLFYGIFSAWVLWNRQRETSPIQFDWRSAAWSLHIPMIRELFGQIATPSKLGPLEIDIVLDWTASALNRVNKEQFFKKFEERYAVQYFYEPFLEAFDPDLRKELGVWYTPSEIVRYMVERVDTVLRQELGLVKGLADDRVIVLDPACGTGSYLVEVLHKIGQTLKEEQGDALVANDIKKAAMKRIFGFEILPAPFVVAHLQIGLLLQSLGAVLSDSTNERAGVYLTNALTGWENPNEPQKRLSLPELEEEREAADKVKRETPIIVILGNPPYNTFAGVSPKEEQGLVEAYKEGLISKWNIKHFNLDDLYVRFFRVAERRIVEHTGKGIICYITNFSFLSDPSFVVMRKRFLEEFDKMWFDCMNGDSRETGKRTPDGKPDPSVFSTEKNSEGIRVGTVVSTLVRRQERHAKCFVKYRDFWGANKRTDLVNTLKIKRIDSLYDIATPNDMNRYSFRYVKIPADYLNWPSLIEFCKMSPLHGSFEMRGNSLIKMHADRKKLEVLRDYLDSGLSNEQMRVIAPRWMVSSGEFKADDARALFLRTGVKYDPRKITNFSVRPFDVQLAYLDGDIQPLFSRPSPELLHLSKHSGNEFLISRDTAEKSPEGAPLYYSSLVCDYHCISGETRHFPIWIYPAEHKKNRKQMQSDHVQVTLTGERKTNHVIANLSDKARQYLTELGISNLDTDDASAKCIWLHSLAISFSPDYLMDNGDGIRIGWPRVPLPKSKQLLSKSVALGNLVSQLLDMTKQIQEDEVPPLRKELKVIGVVRRTDGRSINPEAGDLKINAGWGHGKKIVMPGKGKIIERPYTREEISELQKALSSTSRKLNITLQLGEKTCDIFLNDLVYWNNVPIKVWDYLIGGQQILKKWLSYREFEALGRSITPEEAREFTSIVRRISTLLLLQPALDENYNNVKKNSYPWHKTDNEITHMKL